MAKIVGPDGLNRGTEIVFDTTAKTIQLIATGNLDDSSPAVQSGVTLQAVYSKCKELWLEEADLNTLRFPFDAITEVKMDIINGWTWADITTITLLRDGGWSVRDGAGVSQEEYMCVISLGAMNDSLTDRAYYQQIVGFDQGTDEAIFTGELNEPLQIFQIGTFDYRGYLKVFLREEGKTYAETNLLADQNLPTLDYAVFRVPLANAIDIKIDASDATIDGSAPYTGMSLDFLRGTGFTTWVANDPYDIDHVVQAPNGRWFRALTSHSGVATEPQSDVTNWEPFSGEEQIGDDYYAFNRVIDGNGANLEQIYEFAQRQLRRDENINSDASGDGYGTINGNIAVAFAGFIGDTLRSNPGVIIRNFDPSDRVRIELSDITVNGGGLNSEGVPLTSTVREFPFVSAGNLVFNSVLVADPDSEYRMYFTSAPAGNFDTTDAIIVLDSEGNPIEGPIDQTNIPFTFDFTENNQGGRTPNTEAAVTVVALGLAGAQYVVAEFVIGEAVGLTFPVNAVLERNYVAGE